MSLNTKLVQTAKALRQTMTPTERILWALLRDNQFGVKFRRQVPFVFGDYNFVADFYSQKLKLIIEVDGGIHLDAEVKEIDKEREEIFVDAGYRILRFTNQEIKNDIKGGLNKIQDVINQYHAK